MPDCHWDAGWESSFCCWPCCIQALIRVIWKESTIASAEFAFVCDLKVRVGCQDELCVNSDRNETVAWWELLIFCVTNHCHKILQSSLTVHTFFHINRQWRNCKANRSLIRSCEQASQHSLLPDRYRLARPGPTWFHFEYLPFRQATRTCPRVHHLKVQSKLHQVAPEATTCDQLTFWYQQHHTFNALLK